MKAEAAREAEVAKLKAAELAKAAPALAERRLNPVVRRIFKSVLIAELSGRFRVERSCVR